MRIFSIIFFSLIVHQICAQSGKISGYIQNAGATAEKHGLTITLVDKGYQRSTAIPIEKNGSFLYDFGINEVKEAIIDFQTIKTRLILRPNDNIIVTIDSTTGVSDLKGKYLPVNDLLFHYSKKIDSILNQKSSALNTNIRQLTTDQYKKIRIHEFRSQISAFSELLSKYKITDSLFKQVVQSDIIADYYYDLCIFPFLGKSKLVEAENPFLYFDYFFNQKDFPSNNFTSASYNRFIDCLETSIQIICNTSVQIKKKGDQPSEKDFGKTSVEIFFDNIKDNFSSQRFYHDLLQQYLRKNFKKLNNSNNKEKIINYICQEISQDRVDKINEIEAANQHKNLLDFLNSFNQTSKYKRLTTFFRDRISKPIFLDFWFTNCAPCISEFPFYDTYLKKYGSQVEFIFIGVHMNEEEWKSAVKKYKIPGMNILLNESETALLQSFFEINGYPHHALIEKGGRLNTKLFKGYNFKSNASLIEVIFKEVLQ